MSTMWKRIAILAALGLVVAVAIFFVNRQPPDVKNDNGVTADGRGRAEDATPAEADSLEGEWHSVEIEKNGERLTAADVKDFCMIFTGDELIAKSVSGKGKERRQKVELKPGSPDAIDIISADGPQKDRTTGIYALKKDRLTLCYSMTDPTKRPTELKTRDGDGLILFVLERVATKKLGAGRVPPDVGEFWSVKGAAQEADNECWEALQNAKSREEKDKATAAKDAKDVRLSERCLDVAQRHPDTVGGLSALLFAATRAPKTDAGKEAQRQLAGQVGTAEIGNLAVAFDRGPTGSLRPLRNLAPAFLVRARQSPDHPKTARLLAAICTMTQPDDDAEPPAIYSEAAGLIADKYASSPEIDYFCQGLADGARWTTAYERHLRAILQVNKYRNVRCSAQFALAALVQSTAEDRQTEAETLFKQFLAEFDGQHDYPAKCIEEQYRFEAQRQLDELRSRSLGMPAPEIAGVDLFDKPMKLSEYRGRVVLMNFWATWCFPCMKFIPHEVELAKTFQGQPFEIVGVNSDSDIPKACDTVAKTKMTWRSFRDIVDGKPTISNQWRVVGYPTFYLIDHHGTIRKRWVGHPPLDQLTHMTRILVDAARRNVASDAMQPVVAALALPAVKGAPADAMSTVAQRPDSRFVEKVYRAPDGSESKYVVFVPRTYDGSKAYPAILFLHGSGSRGSDVQLAIKSGLAKAIRAKSEDFPFIAIFPQAREGEDWTAENPGGKRALAILDRVQNDYRIDTDRVSLTGVSMGGQGTWSLAIADPKRWAAIVPICHGGDTKSAARLKDLPCWCFHGDADKMIPAQQSREMVKAIKGSGGRPLYQELIGVGHNDSADRAYGLPEVFEWMLLQNRGKR